ncbi:MAG TPA: AAA family ATPase [Anaerolineales bacterium]|nr:AAA family ATPase [Anaerolineales bacterium]
MFNPILKKPKLKPVFISPRFQQVITLHMLKNILQNVEGQVPLLLGIHGPTGEGKTFQTENALRVMGVKRFLISGGQFDNSISGESAHIVRQTYIRASESLRSGECSLAAVLINDIDTGLGSWGGDVNRYTAYQLSVYGELMHLVDYPNSVEGKDTYRVPIVITGNDFTKLYEPLLRAGRMTAFEWVPNFEERIELVSAIFPELASHEVGNLIQELDKQVQQKMPWYKRNLPVAFYSHLKTNLLDEDLWEIVRQTGVHTTIDNFLKGDEPDLSLGITYERVLAKGLELAESGQLLNHFQPLQD